jgi:hypothetical protein
MNTFLNYIPGIIPVVTAVIVIVLHIKTSKHNFAFENQKLKVNVNSKWSIQWFDFAIIALHLTFITFMNMYFLAGQHDDIILSVLINGFTLFLIDIQNLVFEIDMSNDVMARMKTIKI